MGPHRATQSPEVSSYAVLPEQMRQGLGPILESFARTASASLSGYLRSSVALRFGDMEQLSYGEYLTRTTGEHCSASVLIKPTETQPSESKLCVQVSLASTFRLVEVLMGGKPDRAASLTRRLTAIEKHVLKIPFQRIVAELDRAFSDAAGIRMDFLRLEPEAALAHLMGPADPVVLCRFEFTVAGSSGELLLQLPGGIGKDVVAALQRPEEKTPEAATVPRKSMLDLLLPAAVSFEASLDGISLRMSDLLQLREGHVILFDHPMDRNAVCTLNGDRGFTGQIVSTGKKRAFLIEDREAAAS